MSGHDDFAVEPIPGLPAHLPRGESMIAQARPDWRVLAVRAFHVRKIALWFALLALWRVAATLNDGGALRDIVPTLLLLGGLAAMAIGFFVLYAWAVARSTIYTITTKRLVFRIGVALPVTINLPYSAIANAALKAEKDGSGDIAIELKRGQRVSYMIFWPHARPWRMLWPQPLLRGLADARGVAAVLASAIANAVEGVSPGPAIGVEPAQSPPLGGLEPAAA
jgi:hypothetical protein